MLMVERWRPWHQITSIAHFVSLSVMRFIPSPPSFLGLHRQKIDDEIADGGRDVFEAWFFPLLFSALMANAILAVEIDSHFVSFVVGRTVNATSPVSASYTFTLLPPNSSERLLARSAASPMSSNV
jgi:hypothetical protein